MVRVMTLQFSTVSCTPEHFLVLISMLCLQSDIADSWLILLKSSCQIASLVTADFSFFSLKGAIYINQCDACSCCSCYMRQRCAYGFYRFTMVPWKRFQQREWYHVLWTL
ncbi:hypothetical protein KC19_3G078500 [Ceratodon purpureus]|uniref:Uncharacterized protein n=1 Tax=Ceratodon purpureus TaxID=3225 RepID=A0A8T0IJT3_CERPU|nr:hypothetical protein KC19_3G078500 [Ceratodon purpureus]